MALNPQERATTANQMMQILNNSGGGGDISQLTQRVETLEEEVPVIAAQTVTNSNRITVLEEKEILKLFDTTTTINLIDPLLADRKAITETNFPELYANLSNLDADIINVNFTQNVLGIVSTNKVVAYKVNLSTNSLSNSSDKTYIGAFSVNINYLFLLVLVIGTNTYSIRRLDVTIS